MTKRSIDSRALAALLLAAVIAPGCASAVRSLPGGMPGVDDRLYFGRTIPGGGTVSDADWEDFLRRVVTPRFPDGLTVWSAEGQWRDGSGAIVSEKSFVLELLHPDDRAVDAAIEEIIARYREMFRQESVLQVRTPAQLRF